MVFLQWHKTDTTFMTVKSKQSIFNVSSSETELNTQIIVVNYKYRFNYLYTATELKGAWVLC